MSSRSRKSSGGSSLPKATEAGAMGMYNNILGGQLGIIGEAMGGLIDHGQKVMESNPGMASFIKAAGGGPIELSAPDFLQDFIAKYSPPKPEQTQQQRFGATPPQQPVFDINQHMRNQFVR